MTFWSFFLYICLVLLSHGTAGYIVLFVVLLAALAIKTGAPVEGQQSYILDEEDREYRLIKKRGQAEYFVIQKLKEKMNELIREYRGVIPFEALEEVIEIKTNVLTLLPYLEKLSVEDYDLHNAVKIITDYLPETLKIYSGLPKDFSENYKATEKSAEDILMEQLRIMNSQIQTIINNANNKKLDALIIQGEFLKNKFPKQ